MLLKLSPQDFLHSLLSKLPSIIRILRIDSQSTVSCEVVKPKTFQFPDRILLPSAFVYPFLNWVPFRREGAGYLRKIESSKNVAGPPIFFSSVNLNTCQCHVSTMQCTWSKLYFCIMHKTSSSKQNPNECRLCPVVEMCEVRLYKAHRLEANWD